MSNIGLYYPYIQFKDETWLKLTALYWDQMARIVPKGFPLKDSEGVHLLADSGFVIQRPPKDEEKNSVATTFHELIRHHGDDLTKRYSLKQRKSWPVDPVTAATEPGGADQRLAYVYPSKMGEELAKELVQAGLAEYGPSHPDIGLGMHPRLADVYMLGLARTVARNTAFAPVTDETRNHIGMTACTLEALVSALLGRVEVASPISRASEAEAILLNMAFTALIPENLEHVPMGKIVEIRKAWKLDRVRFQDGLKAIVKDLDEKVNVPDANAYRRHLENEFEHRVNQPLNELRTQLRQAGLDSIPGAFTISTFSAGALGAAILFGPLVGLAAPVAIGLGAYKLFREYQVKSQELMTKNQFSYLVRLERALSPSALAEWVERGLHEFDFAPPLP